MTNAPIPEQQTDRPTFGRFVLLQGDEDGYVTSWDTWEDANVAFESNGIRARMPLGFKLVDMQTGRVWHPGAQYRWEDAQT